MAGKTLNDRNLAARVRGKLLHLAEEILDKGTESEKKELLHKMCNGLLPRLQEHSGADGEPLVIQFDPVFNATARQTKTSDSEPSAV